MPPQIRSMNILMLLARPELETMLNMCIITMIAIQHDTLFYSVMNAVCQHVQRWCFLVAFYFFHTYAQASPQCVQFRGIVSYPPCECDLF